MKKKECLFSFGKINKYFIIPFLCPIFCFLANYFFRLYAQIPYENSIDENSIHNKVKKKLYFLSSTYSLSYFGGQIIIYYNLYKIKNRSLKEISFFIFIFFNCIYIYNEPIGQNNTLKIISILFIISLLLNCAIICNLLAYNKKLFETRLYYLLLLPMLSKIILKSKLFSHQILSLFISIIGIIPLFISKAFEIKESDIKFNILVFFILLFLHLFQLWLNF